MKQLHELLEFVTNGADFRSYVEDGTPFIRVANIKPDGIDYSNIMRVPQTVSDVSERQRIRAGDVLFTRKASFGVAVVATKEDESSIISSEIIRLVLAKGLNPHYLAIFNNSTIGQAQCQRHAVGAVMPGINHPTLLRFEVPVPTCPIQDAIADKMDAAYRRKRELEAEAEALLRSIDGYVLGELEIELPELAQERSFAQQASEVRGGRLDSYHYLPRFTQGVAAFRKSIYPLRPLEDLTTSISGGSTPLGAQYPEKGIPFLRIQNLADGAIDLSDVKYISPETHKQMKRSQLQPLDLLMTITGRVGTCAVVPKDFGDGNINQHIVRMSVTAEIDPYYAAEVLNSPIGRLQAERGVTGTTRIALDYPTILQTLIPLPPVGKQRDIAAEVRRRRDGGAALRKEAERVVVEAKAEVERMILGEGEV